MPVLEFPAAIASRADRYPPRAGKQPARRPACEAPSQPGRQGHVTALTGIS